MVLDTLGTTVVEAAIILIVASHVGKPAALLQDQELHPHSDLNASSVTLDEMPAASSSSLTRVKKSGFRNDVNARRV